ncbi:competence type IV pilus minor pilin ComGF [Bacillus pseudomycoides]|uniref:competence type IV pilus minor pilin ComGF n=2 Tax=Bacillaceae TaxID=186817 RepID=UPI0001A18FF1|nr:ComG operon protein 6 [Bacillus pseudomycoides DSM 12442]OOR53603.1 competence protein ComG [Bacillus pseudomycoides]PDY12604.1 competence protein ComG [Bacillus pseudomycoides]PEF74976.1 competence protein ComG [Bacillus pseudomycoides]PEI49064.1 competence protein ComG [Bacillus pseudomycoides]
MALCTGYIGGKKKFVQFGKIPNKEGWNNVVMSKSKEVEAGFTLLEMMLCLLFLSIFFLLVPRLHSLFIEKPYSKQINSWEWNVFLEQVQLEFRESETGKGVELENKEALILFQMSNGANVTYEMLGNNIVRKVNTLGMEILLQKVNSVSYDLTPYMLIIHVQDISGKMYHGVATRYTPIELKT